MSRNSKHLFLQITVKFSLSSDPDNCLRMRENIHCVDNIWNINARLECNVVSLGYDKRS